MFAMPVVTQLADLFWNLEYCEDPAVKPSIELAKLALVTSKDEEEEEGDKAGTDSSNDTDVTLVEDGSTRVSAPPDTITSSPIRSSFSILGKRSRGTGNKMDIDVPDTDKDKDYVIVSKPGTPVQIPAELPPESQTTAGGDVEMSEIDKPGPTAPVRKGTTGMMFGAVSHSLLHFFYLSPVGRQHDVSECMDSCLFQLECAELIRSAKLSGGSDPDTDKTSIVKR
jgi:ubiquitin carboxyl-terminal hydrolase 25/28